MKRDTVVILPDRAFKEPGNAFSTAIRCLLNLEGPIPHFGDGRDRDLVRDLQISLQPIGLCYLGLTIKESHSYLYEFLGYHLFLGERPDGTPHTVVASNGMLACDPHPDRMGLKGKRGDWETGVLIMRGKTCEAA